jgi:hypothetical protein
VTIRTHAQQTTQHDPGHARPSQPRTHNPAQDSDPTPLEHTTRSGLPSEQYPPYLLQGSVLPLAIASGTPARLLASRVRVLRALLASWEDLVDPQQSRGTFGDDTSVGFGLMPASYSPSVREVERLLRCLRVEDRALWWQLHQRFFRSERKRGLRRVRVQGANGKRKLVTVEVLFEVWDSRVDTHEPRSRCEGCQVCAGLLWLAQEWGCRFEPMLPEGLALAS